MGPDHRWWICPHLHHHGVFVQRTAGVDVLLPFEIASVDASIGRIPDLQGSPREGPESVPKPPFHCEREIAFTAPNRSLGARTRAARRDESSASIRMNSSLFGTRVPRCFRDSDADGETGQANQVAWLQRMATDRSEPGRPAAIFVGART